MILGSYRTTMALVRRFRLDAERQDTPERARRWLREELRRKVGDNGDLALAFTYRDRRLAQSVVQGAIGILKESIADLKLDPASKNLGFIRHELAGSETAFARARERLAEFQRATDVVPPDSLLQLLGQRSSQTQGDLVAAEIEANAAMSRARDLTTTAEAMIRAAQDPADGLPSLLGRLYQAVVEKETKLSLLRRRYTDEHVDVVAARRELEEARRSMHEEVQRQLAGLGKGASPFLGDAVVAAAAAQAKADGLREAAASLRRQIALLPGRQTRFAQIMLDVETAKGRVLALRAESIKAELLANAHGPQFVTIDPPAVPDLPNARGALRMSVLGLLLGAFGAALTLRPVRCTMRRLMLAPAEEAREPTTPRSHGYNHYYGDGGRKPRHHRNPDTTQGPQQPTANRDVRHRQC